MESGKVQRAIDNDYWLLIISKVCFIDRVFCIWLGFDYFDVNISTYFWHWLLTLVAGTAFLTLMDSAKQARPVGCRGIYLSKSCLIVIFFQVEYLGTYVYTLFFSFGDILFYFAIVILCVTMFAANKRLLPYKYRQIGPIFIL